MTDVAQALRRRGRRTERWSVFKKLVYTALVAVSSVVTAALAARAVSLLWSRALHEPPPPIPRWAKFLVASPLQKRLARRFDGG